jgi:hypothetical protein
MDDGEEGWESFISPLFIADVVFYLRVCVGTLFLVLFVLMFLHKTGDPQAPPPPSANKNPEGDEGDKKESNDSKPKKE